MTNVKLFDLYEIEKYLEQHKAEFADDDEYLDLCENSFEGDKLPLTESNVVLCWLNVPGNDCAVRYWVGDGEPGTMAAAVDNFMYANGAIEGEIVYINVEW